MNNPIYLNNDDFNKLILNRKKQIFKFNQLKTEMIFIVKEDIDTFKHIITDVDLHTKTFSYIDLSYPENSPKYMQVEKTKNFGYTPSEIYENEEMFEKNILFKFNKVDENQLMQLYNTTEYEKILFQKNHILSLKKIIAIQKKQFNQLKIEFDRNVYENLDSVKVLKLKLYITRLLEKYKPTEKEKEEFNETEPYQKDVDLKLKQIIEKQKNQLAIVNDKCKKYKDLYLKILKN